MAQYEFVATHGVQLDDGAGAGPWAQFTRDPELDTPEGEARYRCVTEDAKVADRLRGLDGMYGITEVKTPAKGAAAAKGS